MRAASAVMLSVTAATLGAVPESDQRTLSPTGVPFQIPGRDLPVVRQHTYRMAGKIRVLLLWVGRDDVGSGVVRWRQAGADRAFELIIGSDPRRAPGQLNKWGYLVEETRGDVTSVVGLISQENDDRLSDVKADLKNPKEMRAFDTVRGFVSSASGSARVGTLHAPSHLTYRDADAVLNTVLADASLPLKHVERRPGTRVGFISTLVELIDATIARRTPRQRIPYVHGDRAYELRVLESVHLPRFERDGRTFPNVIRTRFETGQSGARTGTRFELVYGAQGPLTGIPVLISYQPKWWLQVDLVLNP